MPRQAREVSESGFYHVMLRGINRMQLFYDDDDRREFLIRLTRYKSECDFGLLAWCLMGNHVHLLVKVGTSDLSVIMKKLELSYSHYYASKYDWRGYLFQGRYKSKPIDEDRYLLAVVRYIHRNPLEAGMPMNLWTSYDDYLTSSESTDTSLVLGMLSADTEKARFHFKEFMDGFKDEDFSFLDNENPKSIPDREAIQMILKTGRLVVCSDLGLLEKERRDEVIAILRRKGLSIRQISRLTGIGRNIIQVANP